MTVVKRKRPLKWRLWKKIRYFGTGIKFHPYEYVCTKPGCQCCYKKEPNELDMRPH